MELLGTRAIIYHVIYIVDKMVSDRAQYHLGLAGGATVGFCGRVFHAPRWSGLLS